MFRDYLEISRLFNMGLTGVAPVLGALSMYSVGGLSFYQLILLFVIGCLAHAYGFVLNDVLDVKIDVLSKDLMTRPLVNGSISRRKATVFAIACMLVSFGLVVLLSSSVDGMFGLGVLLATAYASATIYDFFSKRYPGMDVFVAGAVFFLILFGAYTVGRLTPLAWIVAVIGGLQVLFMNMINGAIKDIDHDKDGSARTLAIRLGARVNAGMLLLPLSFKTTGYLIEMSRTLLVFLPLAFFSPSMSFWLIPLLIIFTFLTFLSIYRLYSIKAFDRGRIRKGIGLIVIFMYATTPIMLSYLNPLFIVIAIIPPVWFVLSNLLLHSTVLEPKTM
jgi:4-hydroxybenzoate polyprenyltransferase